MLEEINKVILLTSTVYPEIDKDKVDSDARKGEYISAINYYLRRTSYNIVIVDNSNYNYADDIVDNRLESLFFKSAKQDAQYGKGYGETKIIDYAIKNSLFLQSVDQIVKITGRHIIVNIETLLSKCKKVSDVYIDVDLKFKYAHSYFFVCNKEFLMNYLLPRLCEMNDANGAHLEHSLAKSIKEWKSSGRNHHEFKYPIFIKGHPGNSKEMYKSPSLSRKIRIMIKYYLNELKSYL